MSKECIDEEADALSKFIIMACKTEFFFSHRVMFFLNTFSDNDDSRIKQRISKIFANISQFSWEEGPYRPEDELRANTRVLEDVHQQYIENEDSKELPKLFVENLFLKKYHIPAQINISNETGYMSALFFIQTLTELCDRVLKSEQKE